MVVWGDVICWQAHVGDPPNYKVYNCVLTRMLKRVAPPRIIIVSIFLRMKLKSISKLGLKIRSGNNPKYK